MDNLHNLARLNPLLVLAIILILGSAGGHIARRLRLPSLTGNILVGVIIGPVLNLVNPALAVDATRHITTFAMTLITAAIGAHLSYHRIHNALKRIALISLFEVTVTTILVGGVLFWFSKDWRVGLLLGVLATATAPATILHIVRESRAKGPVVKTILAVVAMDNILAILLFVVAVNVIAVFGYSDHSQAFSFIYFLPALWNLVGAIVLGLGLGLVIEWFILRPRYHHFSIMFIALLLATGLSRFIGVSPLLTSLVLGIYSANSSPRMEEQLHVVDPITPILFTGFFTMAGVTLHLDALRHAGMIGLFYVLLRMAGKMVGAAAGGIVAGASRRVWQNTALALTPQAGLVLALAVLLELDKRLPEHLTTYVATLVLAAVVANEIIGPFFTQLALRLSGEEQKDRRRLVEFLQEEYIKTNIKAEDKWTAIEELIEFLKLTHRISDADARNILITVLERESESNTAVGMQTALPHGRITQGPKIQGVLGISPRGIDWEAPDGLPVKIIMLIVTPAEHNAQHLAVLAALAAMVRDDALRAELIQSPDAEHAWSIIDRRETPHENYFLEE